MADHLSAEDLAGELERLDKVAATWEYQHDTARITCDYGIGGYQVATSVGETDGLLIVWLRNHTNEIKAALHAKASVDEAGQILRSLGGTCLADEADPPEDSVSSQQRVIRELSEERRRLNGDQR